MTSELDVRWDAPCWSGLDTLNIANFRPESSDHRPVVSARLGYDGAFLRGIFRTEDRYVRSVATGFQQNVCRDSCVEFFVQPRGEGAYHNFEFNAGGAMLWHCVRDHSRGPTGFADMSVTSDEECQAVEIISSLPSTVEPEIREPLTWTLAFAIPVSLLEKYVGALGPLSGQTWRANFYKCGDKTSHPHWGSWMPVSELNFHLPACFGVIQFA